MAIACKELLSELRMICDDSWGDSMEAFFAVAGELLDRGLPIPAAWEYKPGMSPKDPDSYWTDVLEEASDEALQSFGKFLFRYTCLLHKHGKSY